MEGEDKMVAFVEQMSEDMSWRGGLGAFTDNRGASGSTRPTAHQSPARFSTEETVPKADRMALLRRVLASEILPRLALARTAAANGGGRVDATPATTLIDTGELVRLLLARDPSRGVAFVEGLLSRGITPEALYIGILPDAARWLGLMWEEDRCDFAQVTIALGQLQQTARMLSPRFQTASIRPSDAHSLLLLPAPGEQHTFGLVILAEFFQRAGWRVSGGPKSSDIDAAHIARGSWFDVVGFSIGSERSFEALVRTIRQVRRASSNRCTGVIVGGPLFEQRPELAALSGADATAADAPSAVRVARELVAMRMAAE